MTYFHVKNRRWIAPPPTPHRLSVIAILSLHFETSWNLLLEARRTPIVIAYVGGSVCAPGHSICCASALVTWL